MKKNTQPAKASCFFGHGCYFFIVYAIILLIWLIDRINLVSKGIFVACPNCKNKYLIPTYICSGLVVEQNIQNLYQVNIVYSIELVIVEKTSIIFLDKKRGT